MAPPHAAQKEDLPSKQTQQREQLKAAAAQSSSSAFQSRRTCETRTQHMIRLVPGYRLTFSRFCVEK
ncbi:uncharacterized protein V6R79_023863 [Siganus canaliculatus]